jgi:hypothetical protein
MKRSEEPVTGPRAGDKENEKASASRLMARAIKTGVLSKQPCEVCGSTKSIHGHHDDYSKPLEVRWLCAVHHGSHHMKERIWISHRHGPQECAWCHKLTDDEFDLRTPVEARLICTRCRREQDLLATLTFHKCLTADGKLTGQLEAILKRHYPEVAS